jgi:hypothetical protein
VNHALAVPGDGTPLAKRVEERFKATMKGRVAPPHAMWWVYDLLMAGDTPRVRSLPMKVGETPLGAEKRHRRAQREKRWQVSSEV